MVAEKGTDDASMSPSGKAATLANNGFRLPFFSIVTLEVFICCAAITAALISISFSASNTNNDLCLTTGETSIQDLALTIQDKLSSAISLQIATLAAAPVAVLGNLVKLINLGYINPLSIDMMYPYLYQQILGFDDASYVYFGAQNTGNFIAVGKANYAPPWRYQALIEDNLQNQPNGTTCPKICPQNLTVDSITIWDIDGTGNFNKGTPLEVDAFPTRKRPWFTQATSMNRSVPVWTPVYVYSDSTHNIGITACQAMYTPSGGLIGVASVDITFGSLSTNLRALPLTANGFAFIFNTDRVLFGSSVPTETISLALNVSGTVTNNLKYIDNMTDPNSILAVQAILAACNNKISDLPSTDTYQTHGLIFQHSFFRDPYGLAVIVVSGAPLSDYTGSVEQTRTTLKQNLAKSDNIMIAVAVCLCVFFVALSIPATFVLIGRPLNKLANHMEEASRFDFSALHGVDRNARSSIRELAKIESSYWSMISKFAEGIQQNKALSQRNIGSSMNQLPATGSHVEPMPKTAFMSSLTPSSQTPSQH
ncbi:hypothetical protein HK101_007232 [Irineochytrium annulatum]|nr:hypothetical protein HK101_007232 [Irineochytrium annulatum]